jgi:hypothetical protein
MFRKVTLVTAVVGALAVLGATSASARDDDQVRTPSPGPIWVDSGVYGYDTASAQWMVYDVYRLPNGQSQRICHPADSPSPKKAC